MYKVDIYLTQSTASLSKDERWHGYVGRLHQKW